MKYDIKVSIVYGDVFFLGQGFHDFIPFNMTTAPVKKFNGKDFHVANLDSALIEKYGWSREKSAERNIEKHLVFKYDSIIDKVEVVALSTRLQEKVLCR